MLQSEYTMKPHQEPLWGYPPKEVMFSIIKWLLLSKVQLKILGLSNMQRACIGRKYDWKIFRSESKCWHLGCLGPAHQTIVRPGPSSYCWDCLLHSLSIKIKIYIYYDGVHNYYQTINHQVIAGIACYIPSVSITKRAFMSMGYSIIIMIRTKYWNPGTLHILDTVVFRRVHLLLLLKSNANCYICILWTYLFSGNRISESNFISQEDAAPALKLVLNLTWWRSDVAKLREAEQSSKW